MKRARKKTPPAESSLTKYNAACRAVAAAKTVDEIKKVRNEAEAIRAYAKQADDRELELDAIEIRLRAERRLGQMLAKQKATVGLAKGAARKGVGKRGSAANPRSEITYRDLGIKKRLANEARKFAALSERDFEKSIAAWRTEGTGRVTLKLLQTKEPNPEPTPSEIRAQRIAEFEAMLADDPDQLKEFESQYEYLRWLLEKNLSSGDLPERLNSIHKVCADAYSRLVVIAAAGLEMPGAALRFFSVVTLLNDRIDRIIAAAGKQHRG